jgi:hypothetical protein
MVPSVVGGPRHARSFARQLDELIELLPCSGWKCSRCGAKSWS